MYRSIRNQAGLTLTELLTALGVIAISLSMVGSSYDSVVSNNRRATTINRLVSTMHAARSEAITRNIQVALCPSSDGEACADGSDWSIGWMYFTDVDRDRVPNGDDVILGWSPGTPRLTIDSDEFPTFLVYRPSGRVMADTPDDDTGQFTFCDHRGAAFARVVIIGSSGQPSLSEAQADGSAPVCAGG
jgi:type IV fimbrial biogenesis protein FimT